MSRVTLSAAASAVVFVTGAASAATSTAGDRKDVAITIYNDDFGLVREVREVDVGTGTVSLELRDVASGIQPETVSIKSLDAPAALTVREQNYRYDILTPRKLLEKYVGQRVRLYRTNEALGRDEPFDAEVLSAPNGDPVLKIGNQITTHFPGRIAFPGVPPNLVSKPSLVWLLESGAPKQKVEVTYLTSGVKWSADYVLALGADDETCDLTGWVTLDNRSGTSYESARLQLVAGNVQRVYEVDQLDANGAEDLDGAPDRDDTGGFKEQSFFEYHLYTLGRRTTLADREQKQVTLLEGRGARVRKKLVYKGWGTYETDMKNYVRGPKEKIQVLLELENSEKNRLGMALPKGVVRVYKSDKSGSSQFVGEDAIDHTPRDEKLTIKVGEAFDVLAQAKETEYRVLGKCTSESDWEIMLWNHKDENVTVEVEQPNPYDWEIVTASMKHEKKDAHTFTFAPEIKARGEVKITFRVRSKWC